MYNGLDSAEQDHGRVENCHPELHTSDLNA